MATEIKKTREEIAEKAASSYAIIDAKAKEYNDAVRNGKTHQETTKIRGEIDEALGDYIAYQRFAAFEDCAAASDPMLYAIQHPIYSACAVKEEINELDKLPMLIVVPTERTIDLLQLHKHIDGGIGSDKKWPYMVEAFNSKLTARVAEAIGLDPRSIVDSYAMSGIAREMDLGKNPTSNTNLLKTMRSVVAAMIGEEYSSKVTSHDVGYLIEGYSKKSRKALTLTVANHRTLRNTMMDVCRHLVNGEEYAVDYRKRKESAAPVKTIKAEESKPAQKKPADKAAKAA